MKREKKEEVDKWMRKGSGRIRIRIKKKASNDNNKQIQFKRM